MSHSGLCRPGIFRSGLCQLMSADISIRQHTSVSILLNSKTTQRSDAIFIIQINLEKKKLIYN